MPEHWKKVAMLYRKVNTQFEAWFKRANKKALFVQGAREDGNFS